MPNQPNPQPDPPKPPQPEPKPDDEDEEEAGRAHEVKVPEGQPATEIDTGVAPSRR